MKLIALKQNKMWVDFPLTVQLKSKFKLFSGLQEANAGFRTLLTKSTHQLNALAKKLGSCIEKARPYYEALEEYKNAQESCQEAAVQYQRTSS